MYAWLPPGQKLELILETAVDWRACARRAKRGAEGTRGEDETERSDAGDVSIQAFPFSFSFFFCFFAGSPAASTLQSRACVNVDVKVHHCSLLHVAACLLHSSGKIRLNGIRKHDRVHSTCQLLMD